MKLYIDESGNTGETLSKESEFNFREQPYYVLAGLFVKNELEEELQDFVDELKTKYRVQGNELKAKNLYESKHLFITELVEFIIDKKIPFFIELMDKLFYLNIQLVEYFIVPYYSLPINDENIYRKRFIASTLGQFLNQDIYQKFIDTIKENTNDALEKFYDELISHFKNTNQNEIKINVEQTKTDYFEKKENNPEQALKDFLPIPDENPNKRLIYLLPNYNAFTNLIARAQKYINDTSPESGFDIIHDEQKQFDVIFATALELMKNNDTDVVVNGTVINEKAMFNLEKEINLSFIDSKTNIFIQVSDLLAGVIMRFWSDFISKNEDKIQKYLPVIKQLNYPIDGSSIGINYVVPDFNHLEIITRIQMK